MGQTDLSAEYVRKAYELRGRVSDQERLFILFLSDRQVTGNLQTVRRSCVCAAAGRGTQTENPVFLVNRYYLAFLKGDEAGMNREIERAHGKLEVEDWMSHNQALVLARSGQIRNARILWRDTIGRVQQNGDIENAAIYQAAEAVCEAHLGNWHQAQERARMALELGQGRDVEYAVAYALAL